MKSIPAALHILAGLSMMLLDLSITGAMLGMTTPVSPWRDVFWSWFFASGPAFLILGGIATSLRQEARVWGLSGAACLIVLLLGLWTVSRIGWSYGASMFVVPYTIAFGVSIALAHFLRRAWLVAFLGGAIAAITILPVGFSILIGISFGQAVFTLLTLWILVPAALVVASIACSLKVRVP